MDEPIQPQPAPSNNRTRSLILIAIIALVLIAAAVFLWQMKSGTSPEFSFIRQTPVGEEAVVLRDGELAPPALGMEGMAVSYIQSDTIEVALVRTLAATTTGTVVLNPFRIDAYLLGSDPRPLSTDGTPKTGLAAAPDGTKIAYAYLASENPQVLTQPSLADWNIALVDVASGEVTELGQGYRPHLVGSGSDTTLVYATLEGVRVYSLQEGTGVTSSLLPGAAIASFDVSADGSHLVYRDPMTLRHLVFAISELYPTLALTPVGQAPVSLIDAIVSDDTLYGLSANEAGNVELLSFALDRLSAPGTVVRTFPTGSLLSRLIPQE